MAVPRRTVDFSPRALPAALRAAVVPRGDEVARAERALAERLEVPYVVATSSGRAALAAILEASGRKTGEVVVPAFTDESVPATVCAVGRPLRFVDADPLDANPDADATAQALAAGATTAIVAHHFGRVADLDRIGPACAAADADLIEDATHAVGARLHGRPVGTFGLAGYLSFNFTKPLSGMGGGAVVTSDAAFAAQVRRVIEGAPCEPATATLGRVAKGGALWLATRRAVFSTTMYPLLGWLRRTGRDAIGTYKRIADRPGGTATHGPMSPVSAALLVDRLAELPERIARRRELAGLLGSALDPAVPRLRDRPGSFGVAYFFVVTSPDAPALAERLLAEGVDTGQRILRDVSGADPGDFPETARLVRECLQVPIHPVAEALDTLRAARVINDLHRPPRR